MNRKRWLLVALFVGCGAGAATMTVAVPTYTFYSSSNGKMEVTLDGTEYIETFAHGVSDPVTGKYPYIIPADSIPDIHTATYTRNRVDSARLVR